MKGLYKCKNPGKYKGDPSNIVYRSSWELKVFMVLDNDPGVVKWSSEELFIPYRSPKDNKIHRYYPDVIYTTTENRTYMVEIKPAYQTRPPEVKNPKHAKAKRKYLNEVFTWGVNEAKWKAASEYCKDRKWTFKILTEHDLGIK